MKKLYAVSSGSYSDYRIAAIFSSREKADEFMDAVYCRDYNEVEVYELDPKTVDMLGRGYSVWNVTMLKDGTVEKVYKSSNDLYEVTDMKSFVWERTKVPVLKQEGLTDCLVISMWAKSETAAIKIANARRTQMIANGDWKSTEF